VIKRIIGLEGDMVETNKGSLIKIKIPEGHCWVEGDNWNNSVDSNKYGPIPIGLIFGVATHVIWPVHKQRQLSNSGVPDYLLPERVQPKEEEGGVIPKPKSFWQQLKILLYFMNPSQEQQAKK
jgi:signal peptidase I